MRLQSPVMWSSHRCCSKSAALLGGKDAHQLHLAVQEKEQWRKQTPTRDMKCLGEFLGGVNASRDLGLTGFSQLHEFNVHRPCLASLLKIWLNRFIITEPKYFPLQENRKREKKNGILVTESAGGQESQDSWSSFSKEGRESSFICHPTPPRPNLFGVHREAKKQRNNESPQQDSKDLSSWFLRTVPWRPREREAIHSSSRQASVQQPSSSYGRPGTPMSEWHTWVSAKNPVSYISVSSLTSAS